MHTFLSVAAALALAAEAAPATPPSDEGVLSAPPVELTAPKPPGGSPAVAEPSKGAAPAAPAPLPPSEPKPKPVEPATPTLAVIPLDSPSDMALVGRGLAEEIAQQAAKVGGVEVLAPAAVFAKLGPDRGGQVSHCGEATGCYVGPATQLGAQRVLSGWLDRSGTNYRFGLILVDVRQGKVIGRVQREVPIASRRLRADVLSAAGPLLRGEEATTGTLALQTEQPGADVRIDDKPAGKTPLEAKLPAGKHRVEVSQRGKVRVEPFWVDVPPNGRAEQKVRLFDIPLAERKPGEIETVVDVGKDKKRKR